ncbi:AraC family transcriptional regulator [Mycobacterium crocinum]|uniref:AraC family transcriptional regulator n=2 Tax=Mycolicibacterium TaxID=1866885 RepID=A0ABX8VLR4_9MYCO|nr:MULTISPECIES: AraC family transcriptional regulator [Mycolicibacterium]MCV7219210.1 AraC family transcriptional regulator [Mycolicibacterium crocinum]QYL18737.1 AraC family transcriptional regulator [Mycolicibacterium pallens]ULN43243.1 AraC family transcriptional regulator [Mycolicibacterium crocinum]
MSRLTRLGYIDVRRTSNPVRRKVRSRGVPPALAHNEIFYTEDVPEASRLIAKTLGPLSLTVAPNQVSGFAATMHGVRLRNVSMLYLDVHVAAAIDIPMLGPYYGVHMPMNGRAIVEHRGKTFEANTIRSAVTSPGVSLRMAFDHDSPQLIIRVEERAMAAHLTRLLGRSLKRPLVFEPEFDMATEAAMRWHTAVQLIHTEVFHEGSLIQRGQGIGAVEELVMSSLLQLQPSNYHEEFLAPPPSDQRRAVVQNAMNYVDDHLAERITMDAIARAVHMSVRSIQQGFREELGMSPMSFVRERRLERVHEELADALPSDGVTVTQVAERWGFHHLGSFAVEYRKRWGEAPSETLRR